MSGVSWQRRLEDEEELLGEMMSRSEWKVCAKSWRKEGVPDCSVESILVQFSLAFCWSDETLSCCQSEKLLWFCGCVWASSHFSGVGELDQTRWLPAKRNCVMSLEKPINKVLNLRR